MRGAHDRRELGHRGGRACAAAQFSRNSAQRARARHARLAARASPLATTRTSAPLRQAGAQFCRRHGTNCATSLPPLRGGRLAPPRRRRPAAGNTFIAARYYELTLDAEDARTPGRGTPASAMTSGRGSRPAGARDRRAAWLQDELADPRISIGGGRRRMVVPLLPDASDPERAARRVVPPPAATPPNPPRRAADGAVPPVTPPPACARAAAAGHARAVDEPRRAGRRPASGRPRRRETRSGSIECASGLKSKSHPRQRARRAPRTRARFDTAACARDASRDRRWSAVIACGWFALQLSAKRPHAILPEHQRRRRAIAAAAAAGRSSPAAAPTTRCCARAVAIIEVAAQHDNRKECRGRSSEYERGTQILLDALKRMPDNDRKAALRLKASSSTSSAPKRSSA